MINYETFSNFVTLKIIKQVNNIINKEANMFTTIVIRTMCALENLARRIKLLYLKDYFINNKYACFVFKNNVGDLLTLRIDAEGIIRPHQKVLTPDMEYNVDDVLTLDDVESLIKTLKN